MRLRKWAFAALFGATAAVTGADLMAADSPKPAAYVTVQQAGPDYKVQGEYKGEKAGVQVIALGDGKFRAVIFEGGLPGAGWDLKGKKEMDGAREGDQVKFGNQITIADGKMKMGAASLERVVRESPTLGAKPPAGAIVLFSGPDDAGKWTKFKVDERGLLSVQVGGGTQTKQEFQDFALHLEFILPFMPKANGQGRANSGVYPQGRYEIQVLDSFGLKGENNECGGIYTMGKPLVNMCLPPLQWQTYDIDFTAARFENGQKVKNAVITVKHNGVVIQDKLEMKGPTPGGPKSGKEDGSAGPLYLQDHGNPVLFRNIWIVEKK